MCSIEAEGRKRRVLLPVAFHSPAGEGFIFQFEYEILFESAILWLQNTFHRPPFIFHITRSVKSLRHDIIQYYSFFTAMKENTGKFSALRRGRFRTFLFVCISPALMVLSWWGANYWKDAPAQYTKKWSRATQILMSSVVHNLDLHLCCQECMWVVAGGRGTRVARGTRHTRGTRGARVASVAPGAPVATV